MSKNGYVSPKVKRSVSPYNSIKYRLQSPTKTPKNELFKINFDKGNGQFIKVSVFDGDNIKKISYNLSIQYKLSHEQYSKV